MQRRNSCRREAALLPGRPRGEPRQGHAPWKGFHPHFAAALTCRSSYKLVRQRVSLQYVQATWAVGRALGLSVTAGTACQDVDETLPLAEIKDLRFVLFPETGRWSIRCWQ